MTIAIGKAYHSQKFIFSGSETGVITLISGWIGAAGTGRSADLVGIVVGVTVKKTGTSISILPISVVKSNFTRAFEY